MREGGGSVFKKELQIERTVGWLLIALHIFHEKYLKSWWDSWDSKRPLHLLFLLRNLMVLSTGRFEEPSASDLAYHPQQFSVFLLISLVLNIICCSSLSFCWLLTLVWNLDNRCCCRHYLPGQFLELLIRSNQQLAAFLPIACRFFPFSGLICLFFYKQLFASDPSSSCILSGREKPPSFSALVRIF